LTIYAAVLQVISTTSTKCLEDPQILQKDLTEQKNTLIAAEMPVILLLAWNMMLSRTVPE
jgi:hypothetical protein